MRQPTAHGELVPTDELPTVARTLDRWRLLRLVLGLQGLYYLVVGLWPLLHLRSFVWVFGEKRDLEAHEQRRRHIRIGEMVGQHGGRVV